MPARNLITVVADKIQVAKDNDLPGPYVLLVPIFLTEVYRRFRDNLLELEDLRDIVYTDDVDRATINTYLDQGQR